MGRRNLDELVRIWEQWTNGDPLLRHAWESPAANGIDDHSLLDQVVTRLNAMAYGPARRESSTTAAVLAGWAVLFALESDDGALDEDWRRMSQYALRAHKQALEERALCIQEPTLTRLARLPYK